LKVREEEKKKRRCDMAALIRWSPETGLSLRPYFRPFSLLEEVERMASDFDAGLMPEIDMFEEGNELVIKAEMPGIDKKDLDIRLDGDVLTIKAEKKEEKETKEDTYYTRERRFGRVVRYVTLPGRVDPEKVAATLKKGILEVRMPRSEETAKKQIEIKAR
jgi:HSP20 family protein